MRLELEPEVYDHLLELADTDTYGARELRRLVDRNVRQPLATRILELGGEAGVIRISLVGSELRIRSIAEGTMA